MGLGIRRRIRSRFRAKAVPVVTRWLEGQGYSVTHPRRDIPKDFDEETTKIVTAVRDFTYKSPARMQAMIETARYVVRRGVAGDLVECGVWRGGSAMAMLLALDRNLGARRLWLYDTFSGMTRPTEIDRGFDGRSMLEIFEARKTGPDSSAWCYASRQDVERNLRTVSPGLQGIEFVEGKVEETLPARAPERIALLHLDTDWYESTRTELEVLFPRLEVGGVLVVDDYGDWTGSRQAVDEYIQQNDIHLLLVRVDGSVVAIKQAP